MPLAFPGWLATISMLSSRDGWAGGYDGLLLHYDGSIWQHIVSTQKVLLFQLQMLSDTDGWAIGMLPGATTIQVLHFNGQTGTQEAPGSMRLQGTPSALSTQALAMVSPFESPTRTDLWFRVAR